jgi:hypothetical protein
LYEDVGRFKAFVKSGPIPSDNPAGIAVVASNKDNLTTPFVEVYDGRSKALSDPDENDFIPVHRIRPGAKVCGLRESLVMELQSLAVVAR